jgi:DNA mismatch repair ATPase MutS
VLARARAILRALETGETSASGQKLRSGDARSAQLSMFEPVQALPPPSVCETTLRELDIERMTPLDALNALARLKALLPAE